VLNTLSYPLFPLPQDFLHKAWEIR
jgi:hypothetical protein